MSVFQCLRLLHPNRLPLLLLAAVAVALLAGPVHAVTPGPTPVTVTGGTVTTTEAPAQPYVVNVDVTFAVGVSSAYASSSPLPTGKRMVVQSYTAYYPQGGSSGSSSMQVFVASTTGGQTAFWPLPVLQVGSLAYAAVTASVTFYEDAGRFFTVDAYRSGTALGATAYVTISGYLVDSP